MTADAMRKLHRLGTADAPWLTIDTVLTTPKEQLNECICKVGFHKKKTDYLRQVATILKEHYCGDIPPNAEEMQQLPGIGPKMAYLAVQAAWGGNEGIGVDTHVHRISSRLRWVPRGTEEKGPEATRAVRSCRFCSISPAQYFQALESWLPKEYWPKINHLLVGMGQTVCLPRNPLCNECAIKDDCPSSSAKTCKSKPTSD